MASDSYKCVSCGAWGRSREDANDSSMCDACWLEEPDDDHMFSEEAFHD